MAVNVCGARRFRSNVRLATLLLESHRALVRVCIYVYYIILYMSI